MLILITTCYYCTSRIVFFMITKVLHVFAEPWKIQKQSLALTFCPHLSPMHLQIKNETLRLFSLHSLQLPSWLVVTSSFHMFSVSTPFLLLF